MLRFSKPIMLIVFGIMDNTYRKDGNFQKGVEWNVLNGKKYSLFELKGSDAFTLNIH